MQAVISIPECAMQKVCTYTAYSYTVANTLLLWILEIQCTIYGTADFIQEAHWYIIVEKFINSKFSVVFYSIHRTENKTIYQCSYIILLSKNSMTKSKINEYRCMHNIIRFTIDCDLVHKQYTGSDYNHC